MLTENTMLEIQTHLQRLSLSLPRLDDGNVSCSWVQEMYWYALLVVAGAEVLCRPLVESLDEPDLVRAATDWCGALDRDAGKEVCSLDPMIWALACVNVSVGSNTPKSDTSDAWGEGDWLIWVLLLGKEPPMTKLNLLLLWVVPAHCVRILCHLHFGRSGLWLN